MRNAVVFLLLAACCGLLLASHAEPLPAADAVKTGKIIMATTRGELYITLGLDDGIKAGTRLQIVEQGEPIIVDGKTIGFEEDPIGIAEVDRVQNSKLCVAKMVTTLAGRTVRKDAIAYPISQPAELTDKEVARLVDALVKRILSDVEVQNRLRGPAGAEGKPGAAGAEGKPGLPGKGLTPKQEQSVQLLDRMMVEIGPELARLRQQIADLQAKIAALQPAPPPAM